MMKEKTKDNYTNIDRVDRQPLSVLAYDKIREAIVSGRIPLGTKLTETQMAKQLNVSATPVREAFRRLAAQQLVKIIPWQGVVVQGFDETTAQEMYQCREALEGMAARLAAENMDEAAILQVEKYMEEAEAAEKDERVADIHSQIHQLIMEHARNRKLASLLENITDVIEAHRRASSYDDTRRQQIFAEHRQIFEALKKQDGSAAEEAMRTHVRNGYAYIRQVNETKTK